MSKIGSFFFSSRCSLHYQCELTKLLLTKPVFIYCWWQLPFHHRLPSGLREASVVESLCVTCREAELKAQYPPQMVHNCLECSFRGSGFSGLCGYLPSMYKHTNYSLKKLILLSSPYLSPMTPLFFFCQNMSVYFCDYGTLKYKMKNQYKTLSKKQIKHNLVYIQRHLLFTVIYLFTCKQCYVIYYLLLNWIFIAITLLFILRKLY